MFWMGERDRRGEKEEGEHGVSGGEKGGGGKAEWVSNNGAERHWRAETAEGAEIEMRERYGQRVAGGGTRSVCTRRVRSHDGVGAEGDKPAG